MSAENQKTVHGYMAEFDSVPTLLAACRRVRDAGYTVTDAFTPFPVHGIDTALGIKPTKLPWIALGGGVTGTIVALSMQVWMNGINYQYIISGKEYISLPAFIPVSFELTILLASFGAFFGMLALNRLPRFSNPMFTNSRFDAATDDKFFLYIDAKDPRYDAEGVQRLLGDLEANSVDPVVDDESSDRLPRPFLALAAALALFAIIPALAVARMRVTTSGSPRFHVFYDMDFSPAKGAQKTTTLFADGRTMRPDVPGTVSRSQGQYNADFLTGVDLAALAMIDPQRAERLVRFIGQPPAEEPAPEQPPAEEPAPEQPPTEEPAPEQPPAEEPAPEQPPAEQEKPAEGSESETPAAEPAEEETPAAEEKPALEAEMDEKPAEQPAAGDQQPPAEETPAGEQANPAAETAEPATADAETTGQPAGAEGAAPAAAVDNTPWLKENPLPISRETLLTGQQQFNIYCAVCHGQNGKGNGLVAARAARLGAATWVPPTSLHQPNLAAAEYPDGKLFNTITNGIRKMPGYGAQIKPEDRWAVVAYVRALQLSRNASEQDVPAEERAKLAASE